MMPAPALFVAPGPPAAARLKRPALRERVKMECSDLESVGALFAELKCPWYICGGWALDLYLNRVTREHKDVDVAVARADQWSVREYLRRRGWRLEKASGGTLSPWPDGEWLELPTHGVWCRNEWHSPPFVEVLLNEIDSGGFRFRRDPRIVLARDRMWFRSASGLPAFAPEVVLLYKSSEPETNRGDFDRAVAHLSGEGRAWLRAALAGLSGAHPWLTRL